MTTKIRRRGNKIVRIASNLRIAICGDPCSTVVWPPASNPSLVTSTDVPWGVMPCLALIGFNVPGVPGCGGCGYENVSFSSGMYGAGTCTWTWRQTHDNGAECYEASLRLTYNNNTSTWSCWALVRGPFDPCIEAPAEAPATGIGTNTCPPGSFSLAGGKISGSITFDDAHPPDAGSDCWIGGFGFSFNITVSQI